VCSKLFAMLTVPVDYPELGGQGISASPHASNLAALGEPQAFTA
jgi:hypothetical protein